MTEDKFLEVEVHRLRDERDFAIKRAERAEAALAEARNKVEEWRSELMEAWAKDYRATMTALLERGPK